MISEEAARAHHVPHLRARPRELLRVRVGDVLAVDGERAAEAKDAVDSHEALVYRPPSCGYEHTAMANEVVWRITRAARKNAASVAV